MTIARKTIRGEVRLEGLGLHSGTRVAVLFKPGEHGIRFSSNSKIIEATPENVTSTNRCTSLGGISTIEHAMAALSGLEITDVEVIVDAPELPALDGSAKPYVEALSEIGFEEMGAIEIPLPFARVFLHEIDCKIAVAAGNGEWRYEFSCPGRWPELQVYETLDVATDFERQIAPARTFGFESELAEIEAAGLAKGLDLEKALLIGEAGYANSARFEDEPARHKLLDAVGDLYLSGIPSRFLNVVAERTGHRMNVRAAKLLRDSLKA